MLPSRSVSPRFTRRNARTNARPEISHSVNRPVPVHIEVLLPAFVVGCLLARPPGSDPHRDDAVDEPVSRDGQQPDASGALDS